MAGKPRLQYEDHGSVARFRAALLGGAAELKLQSKLQTRVIGREALGTFRTSASRSLPHGGGLADRIAGSRFSLSATRDRIRIRATNPYYLEGIDRGSVKHPVYGHGPVVSQRVTPGWFTRPGRGVEPLLRIRMTRVTDRVATSIRRTR